MSADRFTEVTHQSWFSRIANAIKGILVGLVLFVVSFPLLFWNEGRAVQADRTLREGGKAVVSVTADRVDPGNAGKLIHVTGRATTDATVTDPTFGVSANALQLTRCVEMYQWEEKTSSTSEKKLGGGTDTTTTYSYTKVWTDRTVDSSSFKSPADHQNPGSAPYESATWTATPVSLGAFYLTPGQVGRIGGATPLPVGTNAVVPPEQAGKARLTSTGVYLGKDPTAPQIGDVRITFRVVMPTEVSVLARQIDATFEPYHTKAGGTVDLLTAGLHSADAMIASARHSNQVLTWILRLVGFLVMLFGLNLVLKPLQVLADVLPILGTIVGMGTGLVAFLVASMLSLLTITLAWIFYRPLVGISILVVIAGLAFFLRQKLAQAKKPA